MEIKCGMQGQTCIKKSFVPNFNLPEFLIDFLTNKHTSTSFSVNFIKLAEWQ